MTDPRRDRVQHLFWAACDLPTGQRTDFLVTECGGDDELLLEVTSLVERHRSAGGPLDTPAIAAHYHLFPGPKPPSLETYEILETLGEGGMGIVYLALQKAPVRRKVALKVLKPALATRSIVDRFVLERQALATMHHTGIAQVFDSGVTEDGAPFFAMEHVSGEPITAFCNAGGLSVRERLELFVDVCDAVQHAHRNAIIHRDLKPSNILVCEQDGRPLPKVIDFGIAKPAGGPAPDVTLFTQAGQLLGTPG